MRPSAVVALAVFVGVVVANGIAVAAVASLYGTASFEQFGGFLSAVLTTTASILLTAIGAIFGERLRDEVDLTAIRADVLATVDAAVRPTSAGLWLRERPGGGA